MFGENVSYFYSRISQIFYFKVTSTCRHYFFGQVYWLGLVTKFLRKMGYSIFYPYRGVGELLQGGIESKISRGL